MSKQTWLVLLVISSFAIGGYLYISSSAASVPIGQRTKVAGCNVNGALQDTACTPGAIITTATKEQICVPGYSKTVRNVPAAEKSQVYAEYGIASHTPG
jgi:hypothetical protein